MILEMGYEINEMQTVLEFFREIRFVTSPNPGNDDFIQKPYNSLHLPQEQNSSSYQDRKNS